MVFTIPILVEERPARDAQSTSFLVRPLFHGQPAQRADKLSRALNQLTSDLQELLGELGRDPKHDALARWTFNPAIEETVEELRLELNSGWLKSRFFFASYGTLGRKLCFTPAAPGLHFELLPGQSLAERATAALTRHFRDREKEGSFDSDLVRNAGRMRLTTLEIILNPAALAKRPRKPTRALIFGGMDKKDGERELRKTGRPLHLLYPDDLERAVGREPEVEELARLLAKADRRPILLLGPRQVGKSAILHELVWRICARKKERYGGSREVWLVSPMRLISGMSYLGEWENRVLAILDHARAKDKVLYFDDLLGLFTAGLSSASDLNVAQVLKPALEKRQVRVIGEITPEAWRLLRERDRSFADLFQVIPVLETSEAETFRVLVSVARQLEQQHRCEFSLAVTPMVYDLHRRFGSDAAFPGKAAGFLRKIALRHAGSPVDESRVLTEFQEQSGLHTAVLNDHAPLTRQAILEQLQAHVVGQDHALEAFADVLLKLKARLHDPRRPLGTFLLLGPTGVGKTHAAKALAAFLFGQGERLLRFDLNEFVDASAAAKLTGTAREPEGLLTSAIRRQPFSVLLFDELEKAAPEVFDLLLAVLDEGRLTDALGRVADFTHAIIILTSNLGAREAGSRLGFLPGSGAEEDAVYVGAAEKFFRPEFFNRLDRVIPFRSLTPRQLEGIARALIAGVFARDGLRRRECLLNVTPAAIARLVELGHHPQLGARALKRVVEAQIAQPLAARLAALPPGMPTMATVDAAEGKLALRLETLEPAPRSVNWGESMALPRSTVAQRAWVEAVLDGLYRFLERVEASLEASAPAGRIEVSQIEPQHARYFFRREQYQKVQRIARAAERSIEEPRRALGAPRLPKPKPAKIIVRQFISGNPRFDRKREAAALELELATLESGDPVDMPDSPVPAMLREAALLEAMMGGPTDDGQAVLLLRALTELDAVAVPVLARLYQEAVAGLWGGSATILDSMTPDKPPRSSGSRQTPGTSREGEDTARSPLSERGSLLSEILSIAEQAVWCRGLNLARLLPTKPACVLVRRGDGTLGVLLIETCFANSEVECRAWLKQRWQGGGSASGNLSLGRAIHALVVGKTITDLRSGVAVPAEAAPEEARAFLLSALPLPPELKV